MRWRDGWTDGHADRLAKNPDADKVKKAQPRKRGRKAADARQADDDIGVAAGHS